jgi:hypothetical protein
VGRGRGESGAPQKVGDRWVAGAIGREQELDPPGEQLVQ